MDAEQILLGAIMGNNAILQRHPVDLLRPDAFASAVHGRIFAAASAMVARGEQANPLTLREAFDDDPDLEAAGGGARYLAGLYGAAAGHMPAEQLARLVLDAATRRVWLAAAEQIASVAVEASATAAADRVAEFRRIVAEAESASARTDDRADRLGLRFWSDAGQVSAPDRLVRRLLGTATIALIVGDPGAGKSYLATDLGIHIAAGWRWFGRSVLRGAVVYVAAEGASGLGNRVAAFRATHALPDDMPFVILPASITLGPGGEDAAAVVAAARRVADVTGFAVRLIVVDTLARTFGIGDENAATDMGAFVAACDTIRKATEATVLVVHHRGKNGQGGARGSGALMAAVDTSIDVTVRDGVRVATVSKQKDGADGDELVFRLEVVEIGADDEGEPITACVVRPSDRDAPAARPVVTGKRRIVLDALLRAVESMGAIPPASNHIPANTKAVAIEAWRKVAYEMLGTEGSHDARQKAFKRAADDLVGARQVATWGDLAWPI